MKIVYTGEEMPEKFSKSIFLCGPSLRPEQEKELESWRKDAIQILNDKGFDGVLFCPENRDGKFDENFDYNSQIEWEHKYLNVADCVLFWVPRDLSLDKNNQLKLPAFTTNVEFGTWINSGKAVFGCPEDLKERKNKYLKYYSDFYNVKGGDSLTETLEAGLEFLGEGSERSGGERYVPLHIWNTESFQSWYKAQKDAGNRLDHAELLYNFRPGNKNNVFLWVLKVNVWIEKEQRNKVNEFVLARPDISSVMLWHKNEESILDSEVVIVKEFRSPASTEDGFIRELAGGSSLTKSVEPEITAAEEVHEELNFYLDPNRLKFIAARQLAGTLSSHKCHLYCAELNNEEIIWFRSQKDVVNGNAEDSERTFTEIFSIKDLLDNNLTDWSTLGCILSVINN